MCNLKLSELVISCELVAIVILGSGTSLANTFNGFVEVELTTDHTAVTVTDEAVFAKAFHSFRCV